MMLPIVDAVADAINGKAEDSEYIPMTNSEEKQEDSPHESEQEDEFNEEFNQRTFTSINQLSINQKTIHSLNQMTINSYQSLNPANDPESMVAFLPNVRRNTMERVPSTEDPRQRFHHLNSTNYMFLGGLIMAIAVEHCGLHNRVALKIIMLVRVKGWRQLIVN